MKTLLLLVLTLPCFLQAQYVEPARRFGKGQVDVLVGVGLFPTFVADRPEALFPPLQLGIRWLVADHWSFGVFGGYSTSQSREKIVTDSVRGRWLNETVFMGIENAFHYTRIDAWDLYGGLSLFYQFVQLEGNNADFRKAMIQTGVREKRGRTAITAFIGARFALSPQYTVFVELGYGTSILKIGTGWRLP